MLMNEDYAAKETNPIRQLELLRPLIGKWHIDGQNLEGAAENAGTSVTGEAKYEWLPGGFFLIYKWYRVFKDSEHIGVGMISWEEGRGFSVTNYDNLGFKSTYNITQENNEWKFSGEKERAVIVFSKDGKSFTENRELLENDKTWKPLSTFIATRQS